MAWVVRHFVPYIAEDTQKFCQSMLDGVPVVTFMTSSDLAFAVLVIEHHIMKWRHLLQVELETGKPVPALYSKEAPGLLHCDGIAGREAKQRFDDLNVYFFTNFYSRASPHRQRNVGTLQRFVDGLAKGNSMDFENQISEEKLGGVSIEKIHEDILHRVFYYLHN